MRPRKKIDTSWQRAGGWYEKIVGDRGHYYHQTVVIPKTLKLLDLKKDSKLIDFGCGDGVLGRYLPHTEYVGIDSSRRLIETARRKSKNPKHIFLDGDMENFQSKKYENYFSHGIFILSLQNMEKLERVLANCSKFIRSNGRLVIVLNHPCFRIPRFSGWGIHPANKLQYRYINGYMNPQKIPITTNPGNSRSSITWSFHFPLENYFRALKDSGFLIETLEEWVSGKSSQGGSRKIEDRARAEIPLFMAIVAIKR